VNQKTAARLAWGLWTCGIFLIILGFVLIVLGRNDPAPGTFGFRGSDALFALAFGTTGALIATRRPANPIGWLFLTAGILGGANLLSSEFASYSIHHEVAVPGGNTAKWFSDWLWFQGQLIFVFLLLLFPDGSLPSPRWRPLVWIVVSGTALALIGGWLSPTAPATFDDPITIWPLPGTLGATARTVSSAGTVLTLLTLLFSTSAPIVRYRRATAEVRQQLKWFAAAAGLVGMILIAFIAVMTTAPSYASLLSVLWVIAASMIPVATGIAILRHRLYDIDVVINKAVVFAVLAAFITVVYLAIVVGIGALVGARGNFALSILATAIIAVAFQPARERARHLANRLVYGKRATPYETLSEFAGRMSEAFATEEILPRMARILGEGTGARRAEVWLRVGGEIRPAASWPEEQPMSNPISLQSDDVPEIDDVDRVVAVRHHGELLGALAVSKPPTEPLTPAEDELISDLASQAGLVLRNVRLTSELQARLEELQASRQRLVTAQDEERRRLERNLHDGAQQQLVSLAIKLRMARSISDKDSAKADQILAEVEREAADALEDLRDLARGIYPPLLADQGLVAALSAQARKAALSVEIVSDGVGRYPQEIEAAVYFCCLEALQNAAKYARASRAVVRLAGDDQSLNFSVEDDGAGFDPATTPRGTGLQNMADRVEALGGRFEIDSRPGEGTRVTAKIPAAVGPGLTPLAGGKRVRQDDAIQK
jgi:signal transduction histidine kinase